MSKLTKFIIRTTRAEDGEESFGFGVGPEGEEESGRIERQDRVVRRLNFGGLGGRDLKVNVKVDETVVFVKREKVEDPFGDW
jgi:hypothetical protein